jgi:hypothetical protein
MLYVLTQEEMDSLKRDEEKRVELLKRRVESLCAEVARCKPVVVSAVTGVLVPNGCIKYPNEGSGLFKDVTCDKCPVLDMCTYPDKIITER